MRALVFMLMLLAARAEACSMIALQARDGTRLADLDADAVTFYDFLQGHALPPNDDGYGLVFYNKPLLDPAQTYYATGADVWHLHNDAGVLEEALKALRDPGRQATLALGHARNGSGGSGSHPFTFTWGGRTYSFMHNGDLSNGAPGRMKEALLAGLLQSGWFAALPPSQWSNWRGDPGDVGSWIDSELLFHYLLSRILGACGDVATGLNRALLEDDYFGFDLREEIRPADPAAAPRSVINFVLCDGQTLYVYKNAARTDDSHRLSWRDFPSGLVGVLTDEPEGFQVLVQDELVVIPSVGRPEQLILGDLRSGQGGVRPPEASAPLPCAGGIVLKTPDEGGARPWDLSRSADTPDHPTGPGLISAWPNPCNPRTTIHIRQGEAAEVTVAIHDVQGRRVATLFDGWLSAGERDLPWYGRTDTGESVAGGIYFCVLTQGRACQSTKLLLIK